MSPRTVEWAAAAVSVVFVCVTVWQYFRFRRSVRKWHEFQAKSVAEVEAIVARVQALGGGK